MRSKQAAETTISEKVLHLEKALEEVSVTTYKKTSCMTSLSMKLIRFI